MAKKKTTASDLAVETSEAVEAVDETANDAIGGIVCGRCGKPFSDDQLEKGVECSHWKCPIV
jgi:hypothetical protein